MRVKIGETPVIRGSPAASRTLEVFGDDDWVVDERLEKCVSFHEASRHDGHVVVVFSRTISSKEARAFAELLSAAADLLDNPAEERNE
jgi:hypothetical protein